MNPKWWRARQYPYPNESNTSPLLGRNAREIVAQLFPRSRYRDLMEDERFCAWIENIARGSKVNAEVTLRRMGRLCDEVCRRSPAEIAAMNKTELMTFVSNVTYVD